MTKYIIYRHGANSANQYLLNVCPVAVVEARTRQEACETERHDPPGKLDPYAPAYARLAPHVSVWANQYLSAKPVSRASKADLLVVEWGNR